MSRNWKDLWRSRPSRGVVGALGGPTYPYLLPVGPLPPEGLECVHVAETPAEADWLGQLLAEAGFPVEHVAQFSTSALGIIGSTGIYVQKEFADEARAFLKEFLTSSEAPEDSTRDDKNRPE